MRKPGLHGKRKMGLPALFLIFVALVVSPADAKDKSRGRQLSIHAKDGRRIQGELLAVKDNNLILMDSVSSSGMTFGIGDISTIRVNKRSKLIPGLGVGLMIGGGSGALLGYVSGDDSRGWFAMTAGEKALLGGAVLGGLGMLAGGIAGFLTGLDESMDMEGRSAREIQLILAKLNSISRYPSGLSALPEEIRVQPLEARREVPAADERSPRPGRSKFRRFHCSFVPGYFSSRAGKNLERILESLNFGDNEAHGAGFGIEAGVFEYPWITDQKFYFKNLWIEYSPSRTLALGFYFSPLGHHGVNGRRVLPNLDHRNWVEVDTRLDTCFEGNSSFLTASYSPQPDGYLEKASLKLTGGIGYSSVDVSFTGGYGGGYDSRVFSRKNLSFLVAAEWLHFFNRTLSLGLHGEYKYVPVKIPGFQISCSYCYFDRPYPSQMIHGSLRVEIPGQEFNVGGFGLGLNLGLHF